MRSFQPASLAIRLIDLFCENKWVYHNLASTSLKIAVIIPTMNHKARVGREVAIIASETATSG